VLQNSPGAMTSFQRSYSGCSESALTEA
jgi:hypothetical protein